MPTVTLPTRPAHEKPDRDRSQFPTLLRGSTLGAKPCHSGEERDLSLSWASWTVDQWVLAS